MIDSYVLRIARKQCMFCGVQDARTLAGRHDCIQCAKKKRANRVKLEQYRKDNGLCTSCGMGDSRTREGKVLCQKCTDRNKINGKKLKERKKLGVY